MKTTTQIEYKCEPYGNIATIPKGTPVEPATNLPEGGFWVKSWPNMTAAEESWQRNYGFHVSSNEVK